MFFTSLLLAHAVITTHCDECWLRDDTRKNPAVIKYLMDQNKTTESYLKPLLGKQKNLLSQWQDMVVNKTEKPWEVINGQQYKIVNKGYGILVTKKNNHIKTVIDFNQRAKNHDYYQFGSWSISPDQGFIAITENTLGDDNYSIIVIDLNSGDVIYESKTHYSSSVIWSSNSTIVVIENQLKTYRPYKIKQIDLTNRHKKVLLTEKDPTWLVSSYLTTDRQNIILQSNNDNSSEQYILSLATGSITLVQPRKSGIEYYIDRIYGETFIKSNRDGTFAIYDIDKNNKWHRIIAPTGEIERWLITAERLILQIKNEGKTILNSYDHHGKLYFSRPLSGNATIGWLANNSDIDAQLINIRTMGLKQPPAWQAVDINTGKTVTTVADKYQNFDPNKYTAQQISVIDGDIKIPVSLIYRNDKVNSHSPVVLYGYGAYGVTMRPYFMPQTISLADQGVIYAIAHVRGGGFNGDKWHQAGSGLYRKNSINDFIAVAKAMQSFNIGKATENATLIKRDILAMGSSAGGMLVAAAINQQPQLFTAAVLQVPFVDVLTSMSDPSLPLTAQQYSEWGNPNIQSQRQVLSDYSPMDNIKAQPYPSILVRSGLYDSRVPFWEAAKYIMKIQSTSTVNNPYLLLTDLQSGHHSDNKKALSQQAMDYMFLLNQATLKK